MSVQRAFDRVSARLLSEDPGLEQARMLHAIGLKTAGKFFATVVKDELALKLPARRVAELVSSGTGRPFVSGGGRVMKEWVYLRPTDEAACAAYVEEARSFITTQKKT